jgi:hypothetical protein
MTISKTTLTHYLTEMVHVQDDLGLRQNTHWRAKPWDFRLAAIEEVIEAVEHLKWKWWKNPDSVNEMDIDWEAVHYEAADVFNFLATYLLKECSYYATVRTFIKGYERIPELKEGHTGVNIKDALFTAKDLIRNLVGYHIDEDQDNYGSYIGEELTKLYFTFLQNIGLEPTRLRAIYLAKAELNIFRWENGMKEGTYIKVWNGVKDDVFLKKIVNMTNEADPNYRVLIANSIANIYAQVRGENPTTIAPSNPAQPMQIRQKAPTRAPRPPHETSDAPPPEVA